MCVLIYVLSLLTQVECFVFGYWLVYGGKIDCFASLSLWLCCRDCCINISELRGGQRHDKWISLKNIKMGRIHIAITVNEDEVSFNEYKILGVSLFVSFCF